MVKYLKLFRPLNLLFIIAIMALMRYAVIIPFLDALSKAIEEDIHSLVSFGEFLMIAFSVVLIAAGGYAFNDVQDIETDATNRPKRILVSNPSMVPTINNWSFGLMGLGLILGIAAALTADNIYLVLIHVIAASSLYVYSVSFKKSFLVGNLIIALLAAMVPLTMGIFEVNQLQTGYAKLAEKYNNFNFNFLAFWVLGFSVFAFILTLAREITKDAEDMKGDALNGASTLPIQAGLTAAKSVIVLIYMLFIFLLWYTHLNILPDLYTRAFTIALTLLTAFLILITLKAKDAKLFGTASTLNKLIMVLGMCYALLTWYMLSSGEILGA